MAVLPTSIRAFKLTLRRETLGPGMPSWPFDMAPSLHDFLESWSTDHGRVGAVLLAPAVELVAKLGYVDSGLSWTSRKEE